MQSHRSSVWESHAKSKQVLEVPHGNTVDGEATRVVEETQEDKTQEKEEEET